MPIYEYGCLKCGHRFEIMQKFSDNPLTECPKCSGELKKLISNTSFVLKGSGWYSDGYASTAGTAQSKPDSKPDKSGSDTSTSTGGSSKKSSA